MQSSNPRKRPAPGSAQVQQPAQPAYDFTQGPTADFNDDNFVLNTDGYIPADQTYDTSLADNNAFAASLNGAQYPVFGSSMQPAPTSTDLVRVTPNQQLARTGQQEQWTGYGGQTGQAEDEEDEQELEQRVALAKRDAQGKRKQIPPFVQKLSR